MKKETGTDWLFLILIVFCLLLSLGAVPPQQVTWQTTEAPSVAQGYQYKLYITEESGKQSTIQLVNTLCGGSGMYECSTALPPTGNAAIISNNSSKLTATNSQGIESSPSPAFIGNQGCIFRDNLYALMKQVTVTSNRGQVNSVLTEFKNAKFMLVSNVQKGNSFIITEQCVGRIVS